MQASQANPSADADIALNGVASEFADSRTTNLVDRWSGHLDWWHARAREGVDSYSRSTDSRIAPTAFARDRAGRRLRGVNFASQDYLSLASHPRVVEAACKAAQLFGVHSAGSAALMGSSALSIELEEQLSAFLGNESCCVFPTGWGAGYGVIKTLVRPHDHVIIDVLAHACLQEGADSATRSVHRVPHLSTQAVRRRLERIRAADPHAGILVVTETLFSMDSDTADVAALQTLCDAHDALLLVDVAHDMGCIAPGGRGHLELQDMIGSVDVVMGSFSKSFGSNGGFVVSRYPALKLALRYHCGPLTFTNAMSPIQSAVVLAALSIVQSDEGAQRRAKLLHNATYLRSCMNQAGFEVLGNPSPIVPVLLGSNAASRLMTRYALDAGALVNLVEHPAVPKNGCRWRLQVMADHEHEHIDRLVAIAVSARASAQGVSPL